MRPRELAAGGLARVAVAHSAHAPSPSRHHVACSWGRPSGRTRACRSSARPPASRRVRARGSGTAAARRRLRLTRGPATRRGSPPRVRRSLTNQSAVLQLRPGLERLRSSRSEAAITRRRSAAATEARAKPAPPARNAAGAARRAAPASACCSASRPVTTAMAVTDERRVRGRRGPGAASGGRAGARRARTPRSGHGGRDRRRRA